MSHLCLFDMSDLDCSKPYYSINIYKYRFLRTLPQRYINRFVLLVSEKNAKYIHDRFPQFEQIVYKPIKKNHFLSIFWIFAERTHFRKFIDSMSCDCFFSASNIDYKLTSRLSIRKVVVIHDIKSIWEVSGINRYRVKKYYKDLVNFSDVAITISNYTKENIISSIKGINTKRIKVVYNSVMMPKDSVVVEEIKKEKYILYVNTLDEYKNIITLAKSYIYSPIHNEYKLVVVAKQNDYWHNTIYPLFVSQGLNNNVLLFSDIGDASLKYIYENATLFVSPSLKEGFGYTPIEAAICRCPVICTRCEALPDTTRGLLYYIENPTDFRELAGKMEEVLSAEIDPLLLENISMTFSELYSPEKQVDEILHLLEMN